MARCQKCGNELREGAKFCNKCGAKVTLIPPEGTARIEILKRKIEKESLNPELYLELGEIYGQNGLLQEALVEYQKAVSIDDTNFKAHLRSGDSYLELKELEKAENSYKRALNINPNSPEAKLGLFKVYHHKNEIDKGIELGEVIVQTEPNNLEVHRVLKEIYEKKGQKEEALKELETVTLLAPDDKEALKELAKFYAEKEESEKEFKCYQSVLELDPKDIDAHFFIGRWYCSKGDYQKTIEHLSKITNQLPLELESHAHLCLALAYISQNYLDTAIREIDLVSPPEYEELSALDRGLFAEAYFKIGTTLFENKNFSPAINYMEKATRYGPQHTEYQNRLETVKEEQARLKKKVKKKTLTIVISMVTIIVLLIAGWYLSHGKIRIEGTSIGEGKILLYEVLIDGKQLQMTVPDEKLEVVISPSLFFGTHKVTITKDGYETWEKDVKVGWGKTVSVKAELIPIYGTLRVKSEPSRARVFLDEIYLGETPFTIDTVTATQHVLILQKEGYLRYESSITIPAEKTLNLSIPLRQQTQTVDQELTSKYTSVGTISYLEPQGNNYLSITITTSDSSKVWIWCSGGETTVYKNNYKTPWSDLKLGVKIGVIGKWGQMEGEKQLGAERIDILIEEPNQAEVQEEKKIDVKNLSAKPTSEKDGLERGKIDQLKLFSVRAYNSDDRGTILVNGEKILEVGYRKDSGWQLINSYLHTGDNIITFYVDDFGGGWTYGFQLKKNETVLWQEECGVAGSQGCTKSKDSPHAFYKEYILRIE